MDVGRLIDCVKKHVYLYDLCHTEYKNPSLKSATWESIAKELNESSDVCKLKWKTVRDGYIKYKKQLKVANNSGSKVIDYVWSNKLKFLDNHKSTRRSFYKTAVKRSTTSDPPDSKQFNDSQSLAESISLLSHSPPPLVPFGSSTLPVVESSFRPNKNSRQKQIHDEEIFSKKSKVIDATDHLFLSYSETFKTFSLRQQALLKIELAKLFAHAELEQLDNAVDSEEKAGRNCSPLIIKTEYTESGASESHYSEDFSDGLDALEVEPAKRRRRASVQRY